MLGKLLKYEIKHSARYVSIIYACAGAVTVLMLIAMLAKMTWLSVIGSLVLYFVGIAAVFMTLVSVIRNFYDTLYSRQGYLTFTLPVKSSQLLFSKVVVSFFWIILSCVLMALIIGIIGLNASRQSDESLSGILEVIKGSGLLEMLPSKWMVAKLVFILAVVALLNILTFVGFVYFSVTLSNTRALQKHPKLFGFLIFFGTFGVSNAINMKLTYSLPLAVHVTSEKVYLGFESMDTMSESLFSFGVGGAIFMGLVALGLLILTGWIMEHKVNIK